MKISFIVIAYNEEKNLAATLNSIVRQKGLKDYELIVVNDGSTDTTLQVAKQIAATNTHVRIIDLQPNQGRGAARAAGISAAQGYYYALVDADIILPQHWLQQCLSYIQKVDACGGTAIPDGDVSFVHRICGLQPKVASHTIAVTGSNALFRRNVFAKVAFDPKRRNGEDVALGRALQETNSKVATVPGLLVEHLETKSYTQSLAWLFESGIGASRQFYESPNIRMPDLALFGLAGVGLLGVLMFALGFIAGWQAFLLLFGYLLMSSFMHIKGKFYLRPRLIQSSVAVTINATLLASYFIGRMVGFGTQWRYHRG